MFDIGWTELLVIGIVALIVVGPKDLPVMFHRLGQFMAKARGMAREFQRAMDDAAKESGVKDVGRDLRNITSPQKLGLDRLKDATRDMASLDPKAGPETKKLSEERAEKAARGREATARAASERKAEKVETSAEEKPEKAAASKPANPRKAARPAAATAQKQKAAKPAGTPARKGTKPAKAGASTSATDPAEDAKSDG